MGTSPPQTDASPEVGRVNAVEIELTWRDDALVATVTGEFDGALAQRLLAALDEETAGRSPALLELDLAGVTFLDSTGLRALFELDVRQRLRGGRFTLERPSVPVVEILQWTDLIEHFLAR